VLDGEPEEIPLTAKIQVGISPSMQLRAAPQRLTGPYMSSFLGVIHQAHCGVEGSLKLSEIGQERSDFGADVFIRAVQAYEGIQNEEPGRDGVHRFAQALAIVLEIDAKGRSGDDVDGECLEVDAGGGADPLESFAHDVERILGGEHQHRARAMSREATETRRPRGDCYGKLEREDRLAALRLASDDSHGFVSPELLDEPAPLRGRGLELVGETGGERAHRVDPDLRAGPFSAVAGWANTSR
jgi:hypothetical protein